MCDDIKPVFMISNSSFVHCVRFHLYYTTELSQIVSCWGAISDTDIRSTMTWFCRHFLLLWLRTRLLWMTVSFWWTSRGSWWSLMRDIASRTSTVALSGY